MLKYERYRECLEQFEEILVKIILFVGKGTEGVWGE
jgi:hypothetical protein